MLVVTKFVIYFSISLGIPSWFKVTFNLSLFLLTIYVLCAVGKMRSWNGQYPVWYFSHYMFDHEYREGINHVWARISWWWIYNFLSFSSNGIFQHGISIRMKFVNYSDFVWPSNSPYSLRNSFFRFVRV